MCPLPPKWSVLGNKNGTYVRWRTLYCNWSFVALFLLFPHLLGLHGYISNLRKHVLGSWQQYSKYYVWDELGKNWIKLLGRWHVKIVSTVYTVSRVTLNTHLLKLESSFRKSICGTLSKYPVQNNKQQSSTCYMHAHFRICLNYNVSYLPGKLPQLIG